MSENKITIITDVNPQDNQKKADQSKNKKVGVQTKGDSKKDKKDSAIPDKESNTIKKDTYKKRVPAALLKRQFNLFINYKVIYQVIYCMDMVDSLFSEYEWMPVIFDEIKPLKKYQTDSILANSNDIMVDNEDNGNGRLLDTLIRIHKSDVQNRQTTSITQIKVLRLTKIEKAINDLLCVVGEVPFYIEQSSFVKNRGAKYKYKIVKRRVDKKKKQKQGHKLTNYGMLYYIFKDLHNLTNLPYDVLSGKTRINLGIKFADTNKYKSILESVDIDIPEEPFIWSDLVFSDMETYISTLSTLGRSGSLFSEVSDNIYSIAMSTKSEDDQSIDDTSLVDNYLRKGINRYSVKSNENFDEVWKILKENPLGINNLVAYTCLFEYVTLLASPDAMRELVIEAIRNNELTFGSRDEDERNDELTAGSKDKGKDKTSIKKAKELLFDKDDGDIIDYLYEYLELTWEDMFEQIDLNSDPVRLKNNTYYSLSNLIYSIMRALDSLYNKFFDKFGHVEIIKNSKTGDLMTIDTTIAKHSKMRTNKKYSQFDLYSITDEYYDPKSPTLFILLPFMVDKENSMLFNMINTLRNARGLQYTVDNEELITHSTIQEEVQHWVDIIKYRLEIVETFKNKFIKLKPKKNMTRYLNCKRTPQEMDDVELYRVLYCERQMVEFTSLVKDTMNYINELACLQRTYDAFNITNKKIKVKVPYYPEIPLFEDTRTIKTLINPKLAAGYNEELNRKLFYQTVKILTLFISNVEAIIGHLNQSEEVNGLRHAISKELIAKIQEAKDKEQAHSSEKKDSDNKHNGPVNTIKQAYRLAQTIEKKLIEVCQQQGVQVPEKLLADMPKKETDDNGINLLPPGYGEDEKPMHVDPDKKPKLRIIRQEDTWVRPENPFPYGEDRVVLLKEYDEACEIAKAMISAYKDIIK